MVGRWVVHGGVERGRWVVKGEGEEVGELVQVVDIKSSLVS